MVTLSKDQLAVLAQGPVATVCHTSYAGVPVAVKVFPAKLDRRTLAAFDREQSALRRLQPGLPILRPDAMDQLTDGRHALRMELCAQSLATLLDQVGTLAPADVLTLGYALARALAAAHEVGIAHSGLTPNNVLFRASGEPVVTDFGVALRGAFPRDAMRFIEFLPPEAVRTGIVDAHADLYALGAVMHLALTGTPPHPGRLGEPPGERVLRILEERVPAIHRPDVPVPLSTVVSRLLTVDPDHRPRDAAAVADQLAALRAPDPPAAPAPVHTRSEAVASRQPAAAQPEPEPVPAEQVDLASPDVTVDVPDSPQPDPAIDSSDSFDDFAAPVRPQPAASSPEPRESFDDVGSPIASEPLSPSPESPQGSAEVVDQTDDPAISESEHPESEPGDLDRPDSFDDFGVPDTAVELQISPAKATRRPQWTRTIRRELVIGVAAIAILMVVGLVLLVPTGPSELNSAPHLPPVSPSTPGPVMASPDQLSLAEPADLGNQVVLTWTSAETLDYAVIIAEQGDADRTLLAYRDHTMTIPVDPLRKYCFLVQGTNGSQVYQSAPKPVRGATCHL